MPIQLSDFKLYKSAAVNDTGTNGGRMSANQSASGALANLFAPVGNAERVAGSTKYRKAFLKVGQDGADTLYSAKAWIEFATPGDDAFTLFPATQTDTQAAITGSERQYGAGVLDVGVSAGVTAIDVEVEDGNTGIYQIGDLVRITDKTSLADQLGKSEFGDISNVSVLGNIVTITLASALQNAYSAGVTRVSAVIEHGNVVAGHDNFVVTSAGDGDYTAASIVLNNAGAVEQTWTLTFTGPTNFNIVGDTVGSVGSGTVGGGAAPNNPSFTKPYFTLPAAGFSGTWASGDTIVFRTHPAAIPVWVKRVVPPNAGVLGGNTAELRMLGEVV